MKYQRLAFLAAWLAASATAHATQFVDVPQPGFALRLRGTERVRSVTLRMEEDCDSTYRICLAHFGGGPACNGSSCVADPTVTGATFQVFNTAGHSDDAVCAALPKERWSAANVNSSLSYSKFRYADGDLTAGPVRSAHTRLVGHADLHACPSCTGKVPEFFLSASSKNPLQPVTYTLDEPTQGSVAVVVSFPEGKQCPSSGVGGACQSDSDCSPPDPGSCQDTVLRLCAEFDAPTKDAPGAFMAKGTPAPATCPDPPPCSP